MNELLRNIPEMKTGNDLLRSLEVLPKSAHEKKGGNLGTKLLLLEELYKIYIPSALSVDIYTKLYLALIRSLQKKQSNLAVSQYNYNMDGIDGGEYTGVIGGADSFTIIGTSGVGKTSTIKRAVELIAPRVIKADDLRSTIIPFLTVQCPFDSSVKSLLIEILRLVDSAIGSNYYAKAITARASVDVLIGVVSQVALSHIGVIIIDEIQNVISTSNGKNLVGVLTQLVNSTGVSMVLVGTPECREFFSSAMQLARRSTGVLCRPMGFDETTDFCTKIFKLPCIPEHIEVDVPLSVWVYDHTGGNPAIIISLVHDALELAIMRGEAFSYKLLDSVFSEKLNMLHKYIPAKRVKYSKKAEPYASYPCETDCLDSVHANKTISDIVFESKEHGMDVVRYIQLFYKVEEVDIHDRSIP